MARILVVEDDKHLSEFICKTLTFEHHMPEPEMDGQQALYRMLSIRYDLVVLDWELPGMHGVDVCKSFRDKAGATPVLMLTSKSTINDKRQGLDCGADDYLTKPFHPDELCARIRALLRRAGGRVNEDILKVDDVALEPTNFRVTRSGAEVVLTRKEFSLLELLMRHPGQIFSPESLLDRISGTDDEVSTALIRTHIKNIRKKLDVAGKPSIVQTVHGLGYRCQMPSDHPVTSAAE
jgi:two-component system, OmpR family, response regulator MprA